MLHALTAIPDTAESIPRSSSSGWMSNVSAVRCRDEPITIEGEAELFGTIPHISRREREKRRCDHEAEAAPDPAPTMGFDPSTVPSRRWNHIATA